ncbi:hypothetical protein LCGC14_0839520 [marine sediment metagenome]|uniref:Uncharacterized protein n=1 Tax=marine sediment metagenome TaxID=412755 RepID=A0A0F9NF51_9ZZZZ
MRTKQEIQAVLTVLKKRVKKASFSCQRTDMLVERAKGLVWALQLRNKEGEEIVESLDISENGREFMECLR